MSNPTQKFNFENFIGYLPVGIGGGLGTLALSSATTYLAFSFILDTTRTVSAVKVYVTAVAGTLTGLQCDIYSDSATGTPNASLSNTTTVTTMPTTAGAPQILEFTGLSQSCTAGVRYWVVIRNTTATPLSNYPTLNTGSAQQGPVYSTGGSSTSWGWTRLQTTDGSTWASGAQGPAAMQIECADGTRQGFLIEAQAASDANTVYAKREVGVVFTMPGPPSLTFNVIGAAIFGNAKAGTPTGKPRIRIYLGSGAGVTLLGTSLGQALAGNFGSTYFMDMFGSILAIPGGSTVRVVLSESSQSDSSSNAYRLYKVTVENEANALALKPFAGTLSETYTTDSTATPPVFTDSATFFTAFALLLDPATPYL